MKLLLFADGTTGSEVLDFLAHDYREDLACVVTIQDNAIAERARSAGIKNTIYSESTLFIETLNNLAPPGGYDLGLLAWWPKIIREDLIKLPNNGFINFHPSLLPYNRGKHYNFWALVEQCPFGVSLHFVDPGIDSGDLVAQQVIPYDWTDTGETLYQKARKEMVLLFKKIYPLIRAGQISRVPQKLDQGSFHVASELDDASRIYLDREYKARDLLNLMRARTFPGYPACYFFDGDQKYEARIQISKVKP